MSEWVGHILVAKIVIAAMVTMMRQNMLSAKYASRPKK